MNSSILETSQILKRIVRETLLSNYSISEVYRKKTSVQHIRYLAVVMISVRAKLVEAILCAC